MQLIIGGMGQGKLSYVLSQTERVVTDGAVCSIEEAFSAEILWHFHQFLRRLLEQGEDAMAVTEALLAQNPHCIVICDEVGCGVVPMEQQARQYRETVGRCCCRIAAAAQQVVRVTCGIGQRIK